MENLTPAQAWAGQYVGRLWDMPLVSLQAVKVPITELWNRAPPALRERAKRPMTPVQQALWEVIRDPKRLGTEAVAMVPVGSRVRGGLRPPLPAAGVRGQRPDRPVAYGVREGGASRHRLRRRPGQPVQRIARRGPARGLRRRDGPLLGTAVLEMGVEEACNEIRRELGFGRPPWLERMQGARPSKVPPL